MNLKNQITQGIVFCALMLLASNSAYSSTQNTPPSETRNKTSHAKKGRNLSANQSTAPFINIGSTEAGKIIQVKNGLLVDVLQEIANHTSIQFRISDQLSSHRINVNILAKNWDSAVESLLKDFSKVAISDKYSRLENVLLLGINNGESPAAPETTPNEIQVADGEKPDSGLSIPKLKQLVQLRPENAFPPDLFADQDIQRYLNLKGIRSPNDWQQPNKGRMVLHLAKRELVKLLYSQQTNSAVN